MSGLPCAASTTLTDCGNLKIYTSKGQVDLGSFPKANTPAKAVDPGQCSEGKLASPGQRHHFTNDKKKIA
jgi:hypothetical protein